MEFHFHDTDRGRPDPHSRRRSRLARDSRFRGRPAAGDRQRRAQAGDRLLTTGLRVEHRHRVADPAVQEGGGARRAREAGRRAGTAVATARDHAADQVFQTYPTLEDALAAFKTEEAHSPLEARLPSRRTCGYNRSFARAPAGGPARETRADTARISMLYYLIATLYILTCLVLLLVVLLQQGKGGDIASAFGGSSSQTAFGARSGATLLSRATAVCAATVHDRGARPGGHWDIAERRRSWGAFRPRSR